MTRLQYGNWIPGAVLRVYSKRRGVFHFGIAGSLTVNGPVVLHASKDREQFCVTRLDEFAEGQETRYTWIPKNVEEQQAALVRAEAQIGKPFGLANANCEDYVNFIVTGEARSPQRDGFVFTTLVVLLVVALGAAFTA